MKTIFALFVLIAACGTVKAQTSTYHFTSNQQQQVKYDSVNSVYFIASEINKASEIIIETNIISFITSSNKKSSVYINNINLGSLVNKVSFTLSGRDILSGKNVKLGFWFIDGILEEVSYTNEAIQHSIAYKDIFDTNKTIAGSVASVDHK